MARGEGRGTISLQDLSLPRAGGQGAPGEEYAVARPPSPVSTALELPGTPWVEEAEAWTKARMRETA